MYGTGMTFMYYLPLISSTILVDISKTLDAMLGGGFRYFFFLPIFGEDSHFD